MSTLISVTRPDPVMGQAMKRMREKAHITVMEMATALGYTDKQVRNWEAGTSPTKRGILIAWAVVCEQSPDSLLALEAPRPVAPVPGTGGCLHVLDDELVDLALDVPAIRSYLGAPLDLLVSPGQQQLDLSLVEPEAA